MKIRIPRVRFDRGERSETTAAGAPSHGVSTAAAGSVLRGYGPLAAFAILFILMAGFVPTVDEQLTAGTTTGGDFAAPSDYVDPTQGAVPGVTPSGEGGEVAGGGGTSTAGGGGTSTAGGGGGGGGAAPAQPGRGSGSCAGKVVQVPGDPYAPPCVEWAGGDNFGATSPGVTKDKIIISFRSNDEKGFLQTLATLAGAEIVDTPADIERTVKAFEKFFNQHYQFYGRQLEVKFRKGSGSLTAELLGGGRDAAVADAKATKQEINPFIEMNAASEPFADAITKEKIIGFGTPYLSRDWHNSRRPYAWSIATDCSIVSEVAAEFTNKMLLNPNGGTKKAAFAGDALKDKDRVIAGLAPENAWYQECVTNADNVLKSEGHNFGDNRIKYKLDINSMSNQAAGVVAQLKDRGATTILCGCDPIFPVFLTAKAAEQNYTPEWIVLGTALTDWDVAAQLYDQNQWSHAFGVSSLGEPRPVRAGLGYTAYKSVRNDEPAFAAELIYGTMLLISTGIQMAGPTLTPATFEAGLKAWPGGSGPYGTWGFGAKDYTPTRDYRVIYWNTEAISIVNSAPGAYLVAFDGKRFEPGKFTRLPADQQPPVAPQ